MSSQFSTVYPNQTMAQQLHQDTPTIGFRSIQLLKTQTLGIGAYGSVCKALCDELLCAAKIIHPTLFDPTAHQQIEHQREHRLPISRFMQECEFMSAIRHPNIVQYLGTYQDPETRLPVLLMELMDDNLTHFLESSQDAVPYHIQVNFCHDITLAMSYLHSNGIIHRDLSSKNVLLRGNVQAKVTDFGMAKLGDINSQATRVSFTMCPGTDAYMPPEAVKDPPVYTAKIDCFAVGVLIIQILTRCFPDPGYRHKTIQIDHCQFPGGTVDVRVSEIERRQNHIRQVDPNHPLLPIALDCLKDSDVDRPSAQELCYRIAALKETPQFTESDRRAHLNKQIIAHKSEISQQGIIKYDSQPSSTFRLSGVPVTHSQEVTIDHTTQTLSWSEHGLKIHIAPGTLPETESECTFTLGVTCSTQSNFHLPPDVVLVSPMFYIKPSVKLLKPVTLEIEHCCDVKSEKDSQQLKVMQASTTSGSPPYKFEYLTGEDFPVATSWGHVTVCLFTWYTEVLQCLKGPPVSRNYHGIVHYCKLHNDRQLEVQSYQKEFQVTISISRNLTHSKTVFSEQLPADGHIVTDFDFKFREDSGTLTFDLPEHGEIINGDWKVSPCVVPCQIEQQDIDRNPDRYFCCDFSILWENRDVQDPGDLIIYSFRMLGVTKHSFRVSIDPRESIGRRPTEHQQRPIPIPSQQFYVDSDSDWATIIHYLRNLDTRQIQLFGGKLGLSTYDLQKMQHLPDDMVRAWLRRDSNVIQVCGDRLTWNILAQKLREIGVTGVANDILRDKCKQR